MGSIQESSLPETAQLPVIDISTPDSSTAKKVLDAAITHGFLYISPKGTSFTPSIVDGEFAKSKHFFDLPESEKAKYKIDNTDRGWAGIHSENLDPGSSKKGDFKEGFNIGEFDADQQPQQKMPDFMTENYGEVSRQHYVFEQMCKKLCNTILDLLGEALEVQEKAYFSKRHGMPSGCTVRWLHYPALPSESEDIDVRAGAHSDYGSITLLFQRIGQPGLEILTKDETWAPVPVIPDGYHDSNLPPILVNIGDLLSYWSNGILKSTVHRVIFPKDENGKPGGKDRYSIAYFCHPSSDCPLTPIPSKIVEARKLEDGKVVGYGGGGMDGAEGKVITAKEYLLKRLDATYAFRGEKDEDTKV